MKVLGHVTLSSEQLPIVEDHSPGYWLVRGAAGAGKTTTALYRLKSVVGFWRERHLSLGLEEPVRVLVLTFNRTLRGYIAELAHERIRDTPEVSLQISTFSAWARTVVEQVLAPDDEAESELLRLAGTAFGWPDRFLLSEVAYVLGRFLPSERATYLTARRTGRGTRPQVTTSLRRRLLTEVITPHESWKRAQGYLDWHDLAVMLAQQQMTESYDIAIIDEAQDFSANQIRAVANHLKPEFSCTFIRDTVQRIYANAFTWAEVDIEIPPAQNRALTENHRNTREIAAFARPLVDGLPGLEDGSVPDFREAKRTGPKPIVLRGRYLAQIAYIMDHLRSGHIGQDETVAILHPVGWLDEVRRALDAGRIPWVELTRKKDWPDGPEQIAVSTMHSAKGLEFDHVFVPGYSGRAVAHANEPEDNSFQEHRRLLAMAVGRARRSVIIGYLPREAPGVVELFRDDTFEAVDV